MPRRPSLSALPTLLRTALSALSAGSSERGSVKGVLRSEGSVNSQLLIRGSGGLYLERRAPTWVNRSDGA